MRNLFLILSLLFLGTGYSQELPDNFVPFGESRAPENSISGFELPAPKTPGLTIPRDPKPFKKSDLGIEKEKPISMMGEDGLKEYNSNIRPKAFSKDKEAKAEFGRDEYLGDFKTDASTVSVMFRDNQYVDGDRIRVYVDGEVVISNIMLEGSFRGFDLPLKEGFNRLDFEALNQGTSGPNTAQVQVRNEAGEVLSNHEWNLLTGNKATIVVVKEAEE